MLFVHYRETRSNISVTELFCIGYKSFLTVLYPARTTVFLGPKNTWKCPRRFWRAGEHRERHLQTNIKMLGCFCYLNVFHVKFSPQKRCQRVSWGQGSAGSPPAAVVWVPVALSLLSEIWIQKKANTKPEATAKLPVMYLCWETGAVTQQQPFSLWASQLIHSHIYSSCVREDLILKMLFFFIHEKKGLVWLACMWQDMMNQQSSLVC